MSTTNRMRSFDRSAWIRDDGRVVCHSKGSTCGVARVFVQPARLTENHDGKLQDLTQKLNSLIDEYSAVDEDGRVLSMIQVDDGVMFAWCTHLDDDDAPGEAAPGRARMTSAASDPEGFARAMGLV